MTSNGGRNQFLEPNDSTQNLGDADEEEGARERIPIPPASGRSLDTTSSAYVPETMSDEFLRHQQEKADMFQSSSSLRPDGEGASTLLVAVAVAAVEEEQASDHDDESAPTVQERQPTDLVDMVKRTTTSVPTSSSSRSSSSQVGAVRMIGSQMVDYHPIHHENDEEAARPSQAADSREDDNESSSLTANPPVDRNSEETMVEAQLVVDPMEVEEVIMDEAPVLSSGTPMMMLTAPPLVEASPVEQGKVWRYMSEVCQCRKPIVVVVSMTVVVVIIAVTLGMVLGRNRARQANEIDENTIGTTRETFVRDVLPDYTQASLLDVSSDQSKALDWLWSDEEFTASLPLFRRVQRFALAVSYFAAIDFEDLIEVGLAGAWLSNDDNECEWPQVATASIACTPEGRIRVLDLAGDTGLNGTIAPEISLLTDLTIVDASNTDLRGALPTQMGLLSNLEQIILMDANLEGTIPTELGKLTRMIRLFFDKNFFTGHIPSELGLLTDLDQLQVGDNLLFGALPTEVFQRLSNLRIANYGRNLFHGTIPTEIGFMTTLQGFTLTHCSSISGTIPSEIGQLSASIDKILLYKTSLIGTIPTELQALTRLGRFQIHETQLSGAFPLCDGGDGTSLILGGGTANAAATAVRPLSIVTADCTRVQPCACCICVTNVNSTEFEEE